MVTPPIKWLVANAERLRKVYHGRVIALSRPAAAGTSTPLM
jgi:hypothetical protein